jgi:hypothetical protein
MKKSTVLIVSLTAILAIALLMIGNLGYTFVKQDSRDLDKRFIFIGETADGRAFVDIDHIVPLGNGIMRYVGVLLLKVRSDNKVIQTFREEFGKNKFPTFIHSINFVDCRNSRLQLTSMIIYGFDSNDEKPVEKPIYSENKEFSGDKWSDFTMNERAREVICGTLQ